MRQSSVLTHRCQKHTPSSPTCQGLPVLTLRCVLLFATPWIANCQGVLSISPFRTKKKDILLFIPLHPDSQYLFAVEWRGPDTLEATQYTRTVLQVWGDSPHLFGSALAREMRDLSLEKGALLTIC